MKILIFSWRDIKNPLAGGSELYFHEMAKLWVKNGHHVTMICGGWKNCKKYEEIDGLNVIRAGNGPSLYILAPITYFISRIKPDVIIDVENGIPFFTPLFTRRKKVLHIHHVHKDVWFKELPFPIALIGCFIENKIMPLIYKRTKIITLSNSSSSEIKREGLGDVIGIVNPGISFPKYKKVKKSRKPMILFLNRVKKYKGIQVLLDAVNELKRMKFDNFDVLIAGGGDDLERMKKYSSDNSLDNVKFLGKVSEEKKRILMQSAWIFVNPSFKEGWGIVNIEANYFNTVVIGSNVSGIKDSIMDGKTGLLFEYGNSKEFANKIKFLLEKSKIREKMQKEAKVWAEKFDWKIKAEEYLNILTEIANKRV